MLSDWCGIRCRDLYFRIWDCRQWPGLFHHATITGLAPGTRYFARPLNGKAAGSETTFVTGKALGPDVPVRFVAYGDMSVTGYLPTGQCVECGAVGTSVRITDRLNTADDLDFVLHFGDLGCKCTPHTPQTKKNQNPKNLKQHTNFGPSESDSVLK